MAKRGWERSGLAWLGKARMRHGSAWRGQVWLCARRGAVRMRPGGAWHGPVERGVAGHGKDAERRGLAGLGPARHGVARFGPAWSGAVRTRLG
jgi:hypothetical protein